MDVHSLVSSHSYLRNNKIEKEDKVEKKQGRKTSECNLCQWQCT